MSRFDSRRCQLVPNARLYVDFHLLFSCPRRSIGYGMCVRYHLACDQPEHGDWEEFSRRKRDFGMFAP